MELNQEERFWLNDIQTCMLLIKTDIILDKKEYLKNDLLKLKKSTQKFLKKLQMEKTKNYKKCNDYMSKNQLKLF